MWGGEREGATFLCVHTKTVYVPPSAKGTQHFETKCLRFWDLPCGVWGKRTQHYLTVFLSRDANQKYPDT